MEINEIIDKQLNQVSGEGPITPGTSNDANSVLESTTEGESKSEIEPNQKQISKSQSSTDYDPDWWKKDPRTKQGYFKNEADVIKSYWHSEKEFNSKYKPAYSEFEKLNKTFQELGIEKEKLADSWKEYQTLKDPNHENNQFISKVNYYLNDPEYSQVLANIFTDLNKRDLQRKYPGYTEEQIQQQIKTEERIKQIETQLQQKEEELKKQELGRLQVEIKKEVDQNIAEIMEFAKDKGIQITEEMTKDYFKILEDAKIPPKYMKGLFMQLYQKEIFENIGKTASDNTIKKLNKQNKNVIPGATKNAEKTGISKDASIMDRINHYMDKVGI